MSKLTGLVRAPTSTSGQPTLPEPEVIDGVVDTYRIPAGAGPGSSSQIFVVDDEGTGRYLVKDPPLDSEELLTLQLLRRSLFESVPLETTTDPRRVVEEHIARMTESKDKRAVPKESHEKLVYFLMREFTGFWEIDPLLNDDNLEEISV
ncbi:MAG TPA: hypothetical protein VEB67_03795, partial [Nitrososphaerales archaeon]|nr:hypothetical protein [Nitrososphaerales archaeon]